MYSDHSVEGKRIAIHNTKGKCKATHNPEEKRIAIHNPEETHYHQQTSKEACKRTISWPGTSACAPSSRQSDTLVNSRTCTCSDCTS